MKKDVVNLIGYASGVAANNIDCALGPWYFYYHSHLFEACNMSVSWQHMIQATSPHHGADVMDLVIEKVRELGLAVMPLIRDNQRFCVLGGDHSSAMGTWSAMAHAYRSRGDIGLIWIDAHMDSHTPETSESQNIHGMPLAHLLGQGAPDFVRLFDDLPALKPENICLIGTRSYEVGEREILQNLGVKIIKMDQIEQQGIEAVLMEAYEHVSRHTFGIGISLDLDGIDPLDAPGVGCPVARGIAGQALLKAFQNNPVFKSILGLEIVEYNPVLDQHHKTAKLAVGLLNAIYG